MDGRVISADDHIDLTYLPPSLWQDRLPRRHRERGPRVVDSQDGKVWVREGRRWGTWGSKRPGNMIIVYDKAGLAEEPEPGVWRAVAPHYRLEDMDNDGVYAQVLYNFLDWNFEDQELKVACAEAFNTWLAEEMCAAAPNRLIGVATLPGHDGVAAARELRRARDIGLRGGFIEVFSLTRPLYDPAWEPLWQTAVELNMPLTVHVGAGSHLLAKVPAGVAWKFPALAATLGMQLEEVLATMIFSGVLDRHRKLKFVLAESGIGWIPYVLERLEYEIGQFGNVAGGVKLSRSPSEIFREQVLATFADEKLGVELIPRIGVENIMWAADYPHGDGTFPHSRTAIERMFGRMDAGSRQKVLWDNAARLYGVQ